MNLFILPQGNLKNRSFFCLFLEILDQVTASKEFTQFLEISPEYKKTNSFSIWNKMVHVALLQLRLPSYLELVESQ